MPKTYRKPYWLVLRGEIYQAHFSAIVNGQRIFIRESTHTSDRAEAEEYAVKRYHKIIEQAEYRTNPRKLKDYTIDQAFGLYWEEVGQDHANPTDTMNKLSNLTKYFNSSMLLSHLTIDDISDFVHKKREEKRTTATINRYLALLSAVLNLCKKRRVNTPEINVREFMKPEPSENIKYFDDWGSVNKILANSAEHLKPIILFALYSGLRISNVLNLKWSDIHGQTYFIRVKDKSFKGGRLVAKTIYPPMQEVLNDLPKNNDYVFTYKGERIKSIKKAWKRAIERADVPYQSIHTLRHTHATWMYSKTHDIKFVQQSLNHTSSKTTEKYAHLVDNTAYSEYMSVFGGRSRFVQQTCNKNQNES